MIRSPSIFAATRFIEKYFTEIVSFFHGMKKELSI